MVQSEHLERQLAGYVVSADPGLIDIDVVHSYLCDESYWAAGRPRDIVVRSVANSALVVGAYTDAGAQVGFARMVSDLATFAWLADVFVLSQHQGRGLGRAMVKMAVEHPAVRDAQRQVLATADAHALYSEFGYGPLQEPDRWMVRPG